MQQAPFTLPKAAFTRSVPIRFSSRHRLLPEDWYTEELG
jgi:hypothetical protein